jgi:predicted RNA binding protein YcfA (HicA-like mRNA interferase family)
MALDYSRLRSLTAREIVSALIRDGFSLDRQSGAHRLYRHPDGRRVTVSFHRAGETFEIKTLRSILELQALWGENDLSRLRLI